MKKAYKFVLTVIGLLFLFVVGNLAFWIFRPNMNYIEPDLDLESWKVPNDAPHNAFTDMVSWNGYHYLTYRSAPFHGSTAQSKIKVVRSTDFVNWEEVEEFSSQGNDIRDPKFGIIGTRLFVYIVVRVAGVEAKIQSYYSYTEDGTDWIALEEPEPEDLRFWRPKTFDNLMWYCPIFVQGDLGLYNSTDGINWDKVSTIYDGEEADETDMEFLPDGRILCTIRQQLGTATFGNNKRTTIIAVSNAQYTKWDYEKSDLTRLDGPCLFSYDNRIYAVARYQPEVDNAFQQIGSVLSRKRTALYLVEDDKLVHISNLPSGGDTSYPAAVISDDWVYISYYTNDFIYDYPWIIGMEMPTHIRIAKIKLSKLEDLAEEKLEKYAENLTYSSFPWLDYIVFFGVLAGCVLIGCKISSSQNLNIL